MSRKTKTLRKCDRTISDLRLAGDSRTFWPRSPWGGLRPNLWGSRWYSSPRSGPEPAHAAAAGEGPAIPVEREKAEQSREVIENETSALREWLAQALRTFPAARLGCRLEEDQNKALLLLIKGTFRVRFPKQSQFRTLCEWDIARPASSVPAATRMEELRTLETRLGEVARLASVVRFAWSGS